MVARGVIINNPDEIAAPDTVCRSSCTADGFHIFGPQQPTLILGQSLTLRLPKGITVSARGEYQGGAWIQDGASFNPLSRCARSTTCSRAYAGAYTAANGALDPAKRALLPAPERSEWLR